MGDPDIFEEIVDVDDEQYVLVQFPCFEHYGNVSLVPTKDVPVHFSHDIAEPQFSEGNGLRVPKLTIVQGTLESETPVMQFGSFVFAGKWSVEHNSPASSSTNLAVVELSCGSSLSADALVSTSTLGGGSRKRAVSARLASPTDPKVPSLLQHLPFGVDSDAAAKKRRIEQKQAEETWSIKSVVGPHASLTMERVA